MAATTIGITTYHIIASTIGDLLAQQLAHPFFFLVGGDGVFAHHTGYDERHGG